MLPRWGQGLDRLSGWILKAESTGLLRRCGAGSKEISQGCHGDFWVETLLVQTEGGRTSRFPGQDGAGASRWSALGFIEGDRGGGIWGPQIAWGNEGSREPADELQASEESFGTETQRQQPGSGALPPPRVLDRRPEARTGLVRTPGTRDSQSCSPTQGRGRVANTHTDTFPNSLKAQRCKHGPPKKPPAGGTA